MTRPASPRLRAQRPVETRAQEAAATLTAQGCDRVLIVYEPREGAGRSVPQARVYGADGEGAPRKLEVLR